MNDLPSFLQQTGPAEFTLTLSASAAETLMLCPAKYSWSRITNIEAATARAGMNYGKALHLALAHRYGNQQLSLKSVEASVQPLLEAHFAENPQPALGTKGKPEWRTQTRALQAFAAYNEAYPAEDFEVLGVEEPFEVTLGTFESWVGENKPPFQPKRREVTVRFRGIRDLRVRWHDQLWVLDHKSSTEWSDLTIDEGKCSFQFQGYGWVERFLQSGPHDIELPAAGVIGNYIISRAPYSEGYTPRANALPRDQFERIPYPFSDAQLDEWHARALGIAREIWQHWQEGEWPQRSTACAHWGRCEYYRLCWETDPAYRMAAAMSADYRERKASPFEDESAGKERA